MNTTKEFDQLQRSYHDLKVKYDHYNNQNLLIKQLKLQISSLKQENIQYEHNRRMIHHQLQQLKGNIRVLVRIRPILSFDLQQQQQLNHTKVISSFEIHKNQRNLILHIKDRHSYKFTFDKIFAPKSMNLLYNDLDDGSGTADGSGLTS